MNEKLNVKTSSKRSLWSRVSSVGIPTAYGLDGHGSISGRGHNFFFIFLGVQADSGAHPASYPIGIGEPFPEVKAAKA
jgi:hypothetical protein